MNDKNKIEDWNGIVLKRPDPQIIWNDEENIKNIDVKINELFQYLKGDIQTFEGDCASSSDSDHGKK